MNELGSVFKELQEQTYLHLKLQNRQDRTRNKLDISSYFKVPAPFLGCAMSSCFLSEDIFSSGHTDDECVRSILDGRAAHVTCLTSLLLDTLMIHQLEMPQAIIGLPGSFIYTSIVRDILSSRKKNMSFLRKEINLTQNVSWRF